MVISPHLDQWGRRTVTKNREVLGCINKRRIHKKCWQLMNIYRVVQKN